MARVVQRFDQGNDSAWIAQHAKRLGGCCTYRLMLTLYDLDEALYWRALPPFFQRLDGCHTYLPLGTVECSE